mgnify:FL=1
MLVGTYNVNGRSPPDGIDLRAWLTGGRGGKSEKSEKSEEESEKESNEPFRLPDLVSITFQEVVPLSATNVLLSAASGGEAWERAVADALERLASEEEAEEKGKGGEGGGGETAAASSASSVPFFTPVARRQMVGVSLLVFSKTSLVASGAVRGAQTLVVGTGGALPSVVGGGGGGIGGGSNESNSSTTSSTSTSSLGFGNKGAVAARLLVHSATPLVFVGAHLPSGMPPGTPPGGTPRRLRC